MSAAETEALHGVVDDPSELSAANREQTVEFFRYTALPTPTTSTI